jgi:RHS repeat-associated protein
MGAKYLRFTCVLCTVWCGACSSGRASGRRASALQVGGAVFSHYTLGAGPALYTDATGHELEERRYEPFGVAIDANVRGTVDAPDVADRDLGLSNQRIDVSTGWSDHGARWLAPEQARWTATDPPVMGPSARYMDAPWQLNPYQYVDQNPVAYWDPDGREPRSTGTDDAVLRTQLRERLPDGIVLKAALELAASPDPIAQNTARQLATGRYQFAQIDQLQHVDNEAYTLESQGLSPRSYREMVHPYTGEPIVFARGTGATVNGGCIFYSSTASLGYMKDTLMHEINHDLNGGDWSNVVGRYITEFRAFYVAEFRNVQDPAARADQVKAEILGSDAYSAIKEAYDNDATTRMLIDSIRTPSGNVDNH